MSNTGLLTKVASYYSDKLAQHGQHPRGVDWNGEDSQILRFQQLSNVITLPSSCSVNDLGCGYGAMYDFFMNHHADVRYTGIDVSESMIQAAKQRHGDKPHARFLCASAPDEVADYGFASGVFNVCVGQSVEAWQAYMASTLDVLHETSRCGFAFNCLTSYSDPDKMRPDLYYADPCQWFDFCKRRYSRQVALLHDYGLYEFTIKVRTC